MAASAVASPATDTSPRIALVGNPNAGKTTLFNALTGLRAKTANFPGTTLEIRLGRMRGELAELQLIDMPGLYSLLAANAEERAALGSLLGTTPGSPPPRAILLLLDATNLERNLYLASQVLELGLPTIVALNMIDVAEAEGIRIDADKLAKELGCKVFATAARSGRGVAELEAELTRLHTAGELSDADSAKIIEVAPRPSGEEASRYDWAESIAARCVTTTGRPDHRIARAVDELCTHPVLGVVAFLGVMLAVFYLIFQVAVVPMDLIDAGFAALGGWLAAVLPPGGLRSLLVDGVIAGVGGVMVFLPQICILFFFIALLEDSGYMARAAFVMDRLMQRVGLPGKAFVPMLSAHACAIPAIMAARVIEDKRDRFITILVLPLLTCSARLPVYVMLTALLFPASPGRAALVMAGAYSLGLIAALGAAFCLRRTLLRGKTQPLAIELPDYRLPSLKIALMTMLDRARIFIRKAGTVILAIAIVLWWLSSYPRLDAGAMPPTMDEAALQEAQLEHSFVGRMGHLIEPVVRPLGFDWRIGVGVVTSFAAREVIVSTLSILYGGGADGGEELDPLVDRLRAARTAEGLPLFSYATSFSLLVFFVLAMQCLPTQAVTRRETGRTGWAVFQFTYMTLLAYTAALVTYQVLAAMGWHLVGPVG